MAKKKSTSECVPPSASLPDFDASGVRFVEKSGNLIMEVTRSEGGNICVPAAGSKDPVFSLPPVKMHEEIQFMPLTQTTDWGIQIMGIPNLWRITKGKGIKIAILDTGVDYRHPDLEGAIVDAKDMTGSPSGVFDVVGHGTHTAGIIAARDNQLGVVGSAPECSILCYKVLADSGAGTSESVTNGIKAAIDAGADIISMSLGSPTPTPDTYDIIKAAVQAGLYIICASGNEGPNLDTVNYPAKYPEPISVGAIDQTKRVAKFSSRGTRVDIVAPGNEILSCYTGRRYAVLSGTSMACPQVAGVIALYLASSRLRKEPRPTHAELKLKLQRTAVDIESPGQDVVAGYGLYNPSALVRALPDVPAISITQRDLTTEGMMKLATYLPPGQHIGEIKVGDQFARLLVNVPGSESKPFVPTPPDDPTMDPFK
jgi:subtilisin